MTLTNNFKQKYKENNIHQRFEKRTNEDVGLSSNVNDNGE